MRYSDRPKGHTRVLRCARFVLLAWMAAACTHWHITPVSARTIPNENPVGWTRIVLRNHSVYALAMLAVQSATVVGFDTSGVSVAAHLRDVAGVQSREFSPARTAVLFVAMSGVAVVAFGVLIVISCSSGC